MRDRADADADRMLPNAVPHGLFGLRYGPQTYPEDMRPVMWSIAMAGGYANWYVGTTAWDVIVPGDITPGYAYCRHLVKFFTQASYWLLEPSDGLVTTTVRLLRWASARFNWHACVERIRSIKLCIVAVIQGDGDGYALSDPAGSEVLTYVTGAAANAPIRLDLPGPLTAEWVGEWFDPRTGQRQAVTTKITSATRLFDPFNFGAKESWNGSAMAGSPNATDIALRLTRQ
jgi:hypothetical protein